MVALHHALLGLSVLALAVAGLRLASLVAPDGLARAVAAATFAVAAAVAHALLLGLVSLGGSTVALVLFAFATAAVAFVALPAPAVPVGGELAAWWRRTPIFERLGLGAVAGAGAAWAAWQLLHPAIGFDAVHYHLPEIVIFVQGGVPGSVHDVLPGLPVGNYPLTTEVTIAWGAAIARSFVPLILLSWLTLTLTAASAWAGLRALGVPPLACGLGAAALCTNPWLLAWQSNGSVTDPPALAWLVTCAALCAMSRARPLLLVPAVVAAGLAVGCKTTVLPFTLLVLALALFWGGRSRVRELPWRGIGLALCAALGVGGYWYLRNLVDHGSPFWPIVATPWGDPVPPSIETVQTSFLDRPRATVDVIGDSYIERFGGGLLLLGAGIVLAPLCVWRRRVLAAAAATLVGLLIWARAPVTGIGTGAGSLPETIFSTTRYLLPVVAAACLTLALAGAVLESRRRLVPLVVLAAAVVVNLVQTVRLGYPSAPSLAVPLAGAVAGALVTGAVAVAAARAPSLGRRAVQAGTVAGVVLVGALLAVPASGFVERYADTRSGLASEVAERLANDRRFAEGSQPVATTPAFIGPLAGDRLRHRLVAIPPRSTCAQIAPRLRRQWLVIYGGPLGGVAPAAVRSCLPPAAYETGGAAVYAPGPSR